jgi:hypothetical protein
LDQVETLGTVTPFPHPWRVRSRRFESRDGSTLDPATTWRIDITPGTVNDTLAAIPYLRQNDPRGWNLPTNYIAVYSSLSVSVAAESSPWIDRESLDDLDDPPFLVIPDPATGASSDKSWSRIPDSGRRSLMGGAFCGAEDWELELWQAHVLLSAVPIKTYWFTENLAPPNLRRYRLYTSAKLPPISLPAQAGGCIEIATLYMLRDPKDKDPVSTATIRIRQRVWYPLWVTVVQPGSQGLIDLTKEDFSDVYNGIFVTFETDTLLNILQNAAWVAWWTV